MKKIIYTIWHYRGALPTVLISIPIIRASLRSEGCFGMPDGLLLAFLYILLTVIFLITLVIQLNHINKDRAPQKSTGVIVLSTFAVLLTLTSTALPMEFFKSKPIFVAKSISCNHCTLILRDDQTYTITQGFVEWTCRYSGTYYMHQDTLILGKEIIKQTDSVFAEKYLITEDYLLPLDGKIIPPNSTRWLKIIDEESSL